MNVRNRITALRFLDKQNIDAEYAKSLGLKVEVKQLSKPSKSKSNPATQSHYNNQHEKEKSL